MKRLRLFLLYSGFDIGCGVVRDKLFPALCRYRHSAGERDFRKAKVKQKISGCFRTAAFARAYCRISSYLRTMAALGYNPLVAVTIALQGKAVDCLDQDA